MIPYIRFLATLSGVQFVYFTMYRIGFLILNLQEAVDVRDAFQSLFWYNIKFDLATMMSINLLLYILLGIYSLSKKIQLIALFHIFFYLFLTMICISFISDSILYSYWQSKFNIRALQYLAKPNSIFGYLSNSILLGSLLLLTIHFYSIRWIRIRFIDKLLYATKGHFNAKSYLIVLLLILPVVALCIRGGLREIPLNQSDAFFSQQPVYNFNAINSIWNMTNVLFEHYDTKRDLLYTKMSDTEAEQVVAALFPQCATKNTVQLFNLTTRPNILVINMEGVSADVLKRYNQTTSYMPYLESILDSSYVMDRAYAVGFRTEQGLAGIYSGALTTPYYNLTDNLSISKTMPSILQQAKKEGYYTSFLFGGDIEFAKMRSYLYFQKIDHILDINQFSYSQKTQKLGVEDSIFFKEIATNLQHMKQPYFANILTTSTHEPFDIEPNRGILSEHDRYLRSVSYLDRALQRFLHAFMKQKAAQNTIIVITSDHASEHPSNPPIRSASRYHIPFIVYSPLLKTAYKGYRDSNLYSQCDFSATFSKQFGLGASQAMRYSRNHFATKDYFTYSSFVNGFLYQNQKGAYPFDYIWDNDVLKVDSTRSAYRESLAIMQHLIHFYKKN